MLVGREGENKGKEGRQKGRRTTTQTEFPVFVKTSSQTPAPSRPSSFLSILSTLTIKCRGFNNSPSR
jgi:hypothetical protein